jgi:hypothetical protein
MVGAGPSRRSVLSAAGVGISAFALPAVAAHASGANPTPEALEGAETFTLDLPSYVDTVAAISASSGVTTSTSVNRWHLCYAYADLRVTGARLFGNSDGMDITACAISVAPTLEVVGDFPNATTLFSAEVPIFTGGDREITFATAAEVPAQHYFLVALAGGDAGRSRIDDAPSRIAVTSGAPFMGIATGYWESAFSTRDATTLNGFTDANKTRATSMDRVSWRVDLPA